MTVNGKKDWKSCSAQPDSKIFSMGVIASSNRGLMTMNRVNSILAAKNNKPENTELTNKSEKAYEKGETHEIHK